MSRRESGDAGANHPAAGPCLYFRLGQRQRLLMAVLALLLPTACSLTPAPIRQHRWLTFTPACQQRVAKDLSAAAAAWDTLKSSTPGSSEYRAADDVYNRAVAGVVRSWGSRELPCKWKNGRVFEMKVKGASRVKGETPRTRNPQGTEKYVMEFLPAEASRSSEISPLSLDRVLVAERIRIQRGSKAAVAEGLGVPVVGQIMRSETLAKKQPLLPLNGANLTLTAVIEFDTLPASSRSGEPRRARLRLFNPLVSTETMVGTRKAPLAANYTAAKERALNDGFLQRFSFLGLFFPDKTLDKSGLFLLDPYDPKRIPVVFVHGLVSDPHIWYNAINAISSDPELRARYQPWYFLYPTGISVPSSAKRLRDSLITAREVLDPEHDDPGMNRMVLVGHSMGGLLSRMQTIDSKDAFWRAYFTARPEALQLSAAARERLVAPLQFERQSYVRRLIFVAVPHRGSSAADVSFIYHLSSLIRLPLDSVRLTKEVLTGNSKFLEPQIRKWGLYSFLSVGTLSPRHPFLHALNAQPIPVPHHSIVGRIGFKPLEDSSDGAVPYKSSHLATGSERVVRHWHSCAQKPDVVAEVVLRLKQHLRENGVR